MDIGGDFARRLLTTLAFHLLSRIGATKGWNGQYTVDCATVPSLPDFTLWFDGKPYPLKGEEYILNGKSVAVALLRSKGKYK